MKRLLSIAALGLLSSTGAVLIGVVPANAAENCKTVVTQVINRPDNGGHGPWAIDTFTRTVKICRVAPPVEVSAAAAKTVPVQSWDYKAIFADKGTFVTQGGATLSPQVGVELKAGVAGTFEGFQSKTFTAPADWLGFTPLEKVSGATPTTADWLKAMWKDGFTDQVDGKVWGYKYKTCNQFWIESSSGNSGDITGKTPCPSPSQSASATPTAPVPTTTPVGNSDNLPVTGAPIGTLVGSAVVLMLLGGAAIRIWRKRRVRFEA